MAGDTQQLVLEGLSARYGTVTALHAVDLKVATSECLAVLGANGAGKTTLLRAISGIIVRRHGRIAFDGVDIGDMSPHKIVRLGIGQVPEGRHLFLPLSVAENLEMGSLPLHATGRGAEVEEARSLVFELFPRLAERRQQTANTLSGGEQQMLALGRALMGKPSILLLDEPSIGLAPRIIEDLFAALHRLKGLGLTILIAEQHVPLALDLADRAVVLRLGRIALSGPAAELKDSPEIHRLYLGGD